MLAMDSFRAAFHELCHSSQLQWTLFSVVANLLLTLSIWVGIYEMQVNSELSKVYFLDDSFNFTTGSFVLDGLVNGFCTILILGLVSFIMLAFVMYDFRKVVKGWLILSCLLILFGVSGNTLYDLFQRILDQNTEDGFFLTIVLTVSLTLIYGIFGVYAFLANSSILLHQFFVVTNCSLIAVFYLRAFPRYTTWFVLWTVLFWDIFAVLSPMGPLKKVQEKGSDYSNQILKFLMFAAGEKRVSAGADEEVNEERSIRRDVRQLIQLYSKREAQDDEFLQKIRQRRTAINPDSGLSGQSPMVETDPSPVKNDKEKNSDEENSDDEHSDSSRWSRSSDSPTVSSLSDVSTAEECDQEAWNAMVKQQESVQERSSVPTAAEALNDGETVRLGFGDFVFYSLLIGQAAAGGCPVAVVAAALGILVGLIVTLTILTTDDTTTPALPLPVLCGTLSYFGSKLLWEQFF